MVLINIFVNILEVFVQANNAHGNRSFSLLTKTMFLHNTKVSSSKFQENKDIKKHDNKPKLNMFHI